MNFQNQGFPRIAMSFRTFKHCRDTENPPHPAQLIAHHVTHDGLVAIHPHRSVLGVHTNAVLAEITVR